MGVHHMTREQKQMARRLKSKGLTLTAIAKELSCSLPLVTASVYVQGDAVGRPDHWTPAPGRLTAEEREEILLGLARGESMSAIARSLGRAPSTITREVAANGEMTVMGPGRHTAGPGHRRGDPSPPSCGPRPLGPPGHDLAGGVVVTRGDRPPLAHRVPRRSDDVGEPRDDLSALFVQGRGELRRELTRCLRSGRTARRARAEWSAWQ